LTTIGTVAVRWRESVGRLKLSSMRVNSHTGLLLLLSQKC